MLTVSAYPNSAPKSDTSLVRLPLVRSLPHRRTCSPKIPKPSTPAACFWRTIQDKDRPPGARIRSRVTSHIRPLKTPEDCALAYADLLDDVGTGRLTPEEAQTISAIVA